MTYQDQADLSSDPQFIRRLSSAVTVEAKTHDDYLAELTLRQPPEGAGHFLPFVATAPGFGDMYADGGQSRISDGDILSAVQANWSAVSALWPEPIIDDPSQR